MTKIIFKQRISFSGHHLYFLLNTCVFFQELEFDPQIFLFDCRIFLFDCRIFLLHLSLFVIVMSIPKTLPFCVKW